MAENLQQQTLQEKKHESANRDMREMGLPEPYKPHHGPKTKYTPPDDIAKEPYKGPGIIVTSAGYLGITHIFFTIGGILAGGLFGALAYKQANKLEAGFREFGSGEGWISRTIRNIPDGAQWLVAHSSPKRLRATFEKFHGSETDLTTPEGVKAARWVGGVFIGGLTGAVVWIASGVWSLVKGGHESNKGKAQFERAKNEIWDLRSEYDGLREKYLDAKSRLADVTTGKDAAEGTITVSSDDPPKLENTTATETLKRRDDTTKPTTTVSSVVKAAEAAAAPAAQLS